jgi:hypothetical protein
MELRVTRARRVYADGRHNAFTGIARWGDRVTIAFRSATTHISYDGTIKLIESRNLETWEMLTELAQPPVDLRDPKVVAFAGALMLFCGARYADGVRSLVSISSDGRTFPAPVPVTGVPEGHWLWSVKPLGGVLYGTAYQRQAAGYTTALYRSNDGLEWHQLADFPVPGGETAIDFGADGRLWALVREDTHGWIPALCTAQPPYRSFSSVVRLPIRMQGPMLRRLEGVCVIAGRRWDHPGRRNLRTDLFVLEDGHDIRYVRSLPSGGDTSYAGWLDLEPGRAAMSYYSSHEHSMDTPCDDSQPRSSDPARAEHTTPADIFLADVSICP